MNLGRVGGSTDARCCCEDCSFVDVGFLEMVFCLFFRLAITDLSLQGGRGISLVFFIFV